MTIRTIAAALALAAPLAVPAQEPTVPHTFTAGTPARAAEVNDNFANLAGRIAAVLPVGTVLPYAGKGDTPPAGFLFCDGHSLAISTYPALFAALGNTYGGDGTTNFSLPNLQARFPVGAGPGTAPSSIRRSGRPAALRVQLTINELPGHTHGVTDPKHDHQHRYVYCGAGNNCTYHQDTGRSVASGNDISGDPHKIGGGGGDDNLSAVQLSETGISIQSAGAGQPHDNVPPYVTIRWIIKY